MHIREMNIKNQVYNYYFDNLIKAEKIEAKNILIIEKTIMWWFILLDMFTVNQ